MKEFKWARRLPKSLISNVLSCEPESVDFKTDYRERTVYCTIWRKDCYGVGFAICSCLDEFDERKGKILSAVRAVVIQ